VGSRPRVGYVKTFSSGLDSGSVQVEYGGGLISLPFTSSVIEGTPSRLHSGDQVRVSVTSGKNKKPRVVAIEAVSVEPTPQGSTASNETVTAMTDGEALTAIQVPVLQEGGTQARFTVENFVRSGSRLDFG
jgi:hypothetical protein